MTETTTEHPHAKLLRAIADGKQMQLCSGVNIGKTGILPKWVDCKPYVALQLIRQDDIDFLRIKPVSKPDTIGFMAVGPACPGEVPHARAVDVYPSPGGAPNLKLTFDGETNALKSAEVIA